MDVAAVMDQVAAQLDTIAGLRVFAYPPDSLTPPAAVVSYPDEGIFDESYGRGMDRLTLPVVLVIGRVSDRASRTELAAYCNGSGARSVKAVVEAGAAYTAFHSVRVISFEVEAVTIGGADHIAATFDLDIAGSGA
jgi:hypothetical protein